MAKYRLSNRAASDVSDIASFTIQKFGITQARRYGQGLEKALLGLADMPPQARNAQGLAPNLKRLTYKSHVIFFRVDDEGAFVVRVLHQRMAFPRHFPKGD